MSCPHPCGHQKLTHHARLRLGLPQAGRARDLSAASALDIDHLYLADFERFAEKTRADSGEALCVVGGEA